MFRLWGKMFSDNRMIRDYVYECHSDDPDRTRTRRIFDGLEEICKQFDLSVPVWLDSNIKEFKKVDKTRFTSDNFIDLIDFDYLEIHIIDE